MPGTSDIDLKSLKISFSFFCSRLLLFFQIPVLLSKEQLFKKKKDNN